MNLGVINMNLKFEEVTYDNLELAVKIQNDKIIIDKKYLIY